MKLSYFSRRLNNSKGGGEQCDEYLIELINNHKNNKIEVITENEKRLIRQSSKRTITNRIVEELDEIYFYIRNINSIISSNYLIITGRSLTASLISILKPGNVVHNIHGRTNPLALIIFRITKTKLIFWGNSYKMSNSPKYIDHLKNILPISSLINKIIIKKNLVEERYESINKESNNILWIGRLEPIKDPFLILESIEKLSKIKENWEFNLIGDGSMRNLLEKKYNNYNQKLRSRINILGNINNKNLDLYYSKSNILVITSLSENFPIVAIEAILHGVKIISSPIKELQKSILSDYIEFSLSRDPSDMARCIEKNMKNKTLHHNQNEFIKDIIKKYNLQSRKLKEWLK